MARTRKQRTDPTLQDALFSLAVLAPSAPVVAADWPDGRVYTPAEVAPLLPPHPPAPRYRACTLCGGYLQGTREATGECLNCVEGRGWAVQAVLDEEERWQRRRSRTGPA